MDPLILEKAIEYIGQLEDGQTDTTARIIRGIDPTVPEDELIDYHFAICDEMAYDEDVVLDFSAHDGEKGMPYDHPFTAVRMVTSCGGIRKEPFRYRAGQMFLRYIDLIYGVDELWEKYLTYASQEFGRNKTPRFFAYIREDGCKEVWAQLLDNMGGGVRLSFFSAMCFELLSWRDAGHDLDRELERIRDGT